MGFVFSSNKFPSIWGSFYSYYVNFRFFVGEQRIRGGVPFETYGDAAAIWTEEADIVSEWLGWGDPTWPGFKRKWLWHRFTREATEDWIPPLEWILKTRLSAIALPQEPQVRKVIRCDGFKRTIRINLERREG